MKQIFTLILFFCGGLTLSGQVISPDLLCVRNDSLFWQAPANNCGDFISYDIFLSSTPEGPFTLLTEVTDEGQSSFFHNNTGGLFYYYIAGNYDCPGEPVIFSDTLDNLQPPAVSLDYASVVGANIELSWQLSEVPEVIGYVIFRETEVGVVPIDTVFGAVNTYLDNNAAPDTNTETYFVLALDACGGTSVFGTDHKTIFLTVETEDCDGFTQLSWSAYSGWDEVEKYEIHLSINNGPSEFVGEVSGAELNFNYPEPENENIYCFFVRAVESGTNNIADSNIACDTVNVSQPVNDFSITNISVNSLDEIEVAWTWDGSGLLTAYDVNQGIDPLTTVQIFSEQPGDALPLFNTFTDTQTNPSANRSYYTISLTDDCGNNIMSTPAGHLFAQGSVLADNSNQITWTPLDIENSSVDSYEIFADLNGTFESVGLVSGEETTFFYKPELALGRDSTCYYVVANAQVELFNNNLRLIESRSNRVCLAPNTIIHFPNAFAPQGVNREFKAVAAFTAGVDFEMQIFNRFGQEIFTTQDISQGWDGYLDGRIAQQGVYVYKAKVTQENGRILEKSGTFLLIK